MEPGQPKLIKGLQAEYVPAIYPGANTSGMKVWGKNVLLRVDECAEQTGGGIHITQDMQERMTEGATTGCIFALGPEAFRLFDDNSRWTGEHPNVGDRVYFEKYAGTLQRGADGNIYRIVDYRAIAAGIDESYLNEVGVDHAPAAHST